jgi:hypothetical protein
VGYGRQRQQGLLTPDQLHLAGVSGVRQGMVVVSQLTLARKAEMNPFRTSLDRATLAMKSQAALPEIKRAESEEDIIRAEITLDLHDSAIVQPGKLWN